MQELFNLYYLYDYMVKHSNTEEKWREYIYLRNYVASMIEGEGTIQSLLFGWRVLAQNAPNFHYITWLKICQEKDEKNIAQKYFPNFGYSTRLTFLFYFAIINLSKERRKQK